MVMPSEATRGFSPLAVANELIEISMPHGIDHLRLQKELYIAHGVHLAAGQGPLVRDGFKAWQYGPVSPAVYHAAKNCGPRIQDPLSTDRIDSEAFAGTPDPEYVRKLLAHVFRKYVDLTSFQLVDLTHRKGTPWDLVTQGGAAIGTNVAIPDDLIQKHYEKLLGP